MRTDRFRPIQAEDLGLAVFLRQAVEKVDWRVELAFGYRVETECNPLGANADRIDIVLETANHVVGIEIKIGAELGRDQLERYVAAIETRAAWQHGTAHVVLLAPFESAVEKVRSVSWSAVSDAPPPVALAEEQGRAHRSYFFDGRRLVDVSPSTTFEDAGDNPGAGGLRLRSL